MNTVSFLEAARLLKEGKIGVMPTDTVYGLVGQALSKETVERIYDVKGRDEGKPFIVLIDSMDDLARFGARPDNNAVEFLNDYWPGKVSAILPVEGGFEYLHRGTKAIAFRMPEKEELDGVIAEAGPLVAPSANPQGQPPATSIDEAHRYFGGSVDFYVDGGDIDSEPSTVVRLGGGSVEVVRLGATDIKPLE